jgi:hypothetical protein
MTTAAVMVACGGLATEESGGGFDASGDLGIDRFGDSSGTIGSGGSRGSGGSQGSAGAPGSGGSMGGGSGGAAGSGTGGEPIVSGLAGCYTFPSSDWCLFNQYPGPSCSTLGDPRDEKFGHCPTENSNSSPLYGCCVYVWLKVPEAGAHPFWADCYYDAIYGASQQGKCKPGSTKERGGAKTVGWQWIAP